MGERIAVGDKLPFFVYDTPYSAQNRFRDLLQRKSPLVLVFMANFGHPITRTFASRYANTYGSLRDGGFALVVRSRADKLSRSIGPNTLPYPLLCDAEGVLYEHLDIPQSSSALMTYSLEGWRILRDAKRQGYQAAKGQMQQLPLTLTQVCTIPAEHGLIAIRQPADEAVRIGQFCGIDTFFIRGIQPPVSNIFPYRAGKKMRILQNHGNILAQNIPLNILYILSVYGDGALINVIESVKQIGHRGFARTG